MLGVSLRDNIGLKTADKTAGNGSAELRGNGRGGRTDPSPGKKKENKKMRLKTAEKTRKLVSLFY